MRKSEKKSRKVRRSKETNKTKIRTHIVMASYCCSEMRVVNNIKIYRSMCMHERWGRRVLENKKINQRIFIEYL